MAKIMLIEDNEIVCHALAVFLREEGHDVAEFTDSSQSIALMGEVAADHSLSSRFLAGGGADFSRLRR